MFRSRFDEVVEVDEVEAHRGLVVVAVVDRSPADRLLADSLFFISRACVAH